MVVKDATAACLAVRFRAVFAGGKLVRNGPLICQTIPVQP